MFVSKFEPDSSCLGGVYDVVLASRFRWRQLLLLCKTKDYQPHEAE